MGCLRIVKVVTSRDSIRNNGIRDGLKAEPLIQGIENQQLQWFRHLIKMSDEIPIKVMWKARVPSKRNRRSLRRTWNDEVDEILSER